MSFKDKLQDKILSWIPEDKIRIASVLAKSGTSGSGKTKKTEIKKAATAFEVKTLKDWKNAVALATDYENPELLHLAQLYDNLLLDGHTYSVIETRVHRVLRSKFKIVNASGEENADLKYMFESPWFEGFVRHALWSKFTGTKVIELFELDSELALKKATLIPMAHTNIKKGLILKEAGDASGWPYMEGQLARYYVQVGSNGDLGLLSQMAPLILAKKLAMGSWLDYIEKYGIPPVWITTDNMTEARANELLDMGINMISNHVAVVRGQETITVGDTPKTDAHKVFQELIFVLNSEISKLVLGQDGTTDLSNNSGTYGSLKILSEVADDRHESDKLFIQHIINKELIPRLPLISSYYSSINGHKLDWDESDEMANDILIDKVVSLTNAGYTMDIENIAQRTGIPITGFVSKTTTTTEEESGEKKKVKK